MAYFPMCVELDGKRCVVVGGGKVATGKVRQLLEFGADVTVIAPEVTQELRDMAEAGRIVWEQCALGELCQPERSPEMISSEAGVPAGRSESIRPGTGSAAQEICVPGRLPEDAMLVVAATDQTDVNSAVSKWCRERRIPVNVVDEKELCTCFFPAIARDGDVVVAVSTGGTSPALAARIRKRVEAELLGTAGDDSAAGGQERPGAARGREPRYGYAAEVMGEWREYVKRRIPSGAVRKRVFEELLNRVLAGQELSEEEMMRVMEEKSADVSGEEKRNTQEETACVQRQEGNLCGRTGAGVPGRIRIGTRGSRLALAQTELFIARVKEQYPKIECETIVIRTTGDRISDRPLSEFGGKAVFVTEFEDAIRAGQIDYAVHSAKDMPAELSGGLDIVCVLPREDVRDVLLTKAGREIGKTEAAVIGTGSLRRQSQLLKLYPHAVPKQLRGNITTRIEKLKAGEYDGIILAAAGLKRLGLDRDKALAYRYLSAEEMVPAGGQALIAVEGRSGGQEYLRAVSDPLAEAALRAEREVLRLLGAGCHEAVGVCAQFCDEAGGAESEAVAEPETTADKAVWDAWEKQNTISVDEKRESGLKPAPERKWMRLLVMKETDGVIHRSTGSAPAEQWRELAERVVDAL